VAIFKRGVGDRQAAGEEEEEEEEEAEEGDVWGGVATKWFLA